MRAAGVHRFGGPEVLEVVELPAPEPGEEEVLIRVAAATVNPADIALRAGAFAGMLQADPPYIAGLELAGEVERAGAGTGWQPGDRVAAVTTFAGHGRGGQAEYAVVHADSVTGVPAAVGLEAAATLPMNGLTVRHALDRLALAPGDTIAVTGAAGAVGGYVVELAVAEGLRTVAVASPGDEEFVRGLGADTFVPRGERAVEGIREAVPGGVDGLVDAAVIGAPMLAAVRDGGGYAALRGYEGETERGIAIHPVVYWEYAHERGKLQDLMRLVEEGTLTLRVAETFPAESAADAHRRLEAGGVRGRLVLTF